MVAPRVLYGPLSVGTVIERTSREKSPVPARPRSTSLDLARHEAAAMALAARLRRPCFVFAIRPVIRMRREHRRLSHHQVAHLAQRAVPMFKSSHYKVQSHLETNIKRPGFAIFEADWPDLGHFNIRAVSANLGEVRHVRE